MKWRYEKSTKTIRTIPQNHWVASMDSWDGAENHEKNAALIAAAPDLLASLRLILDAAEDGDVLSNPQLFAENIHHIARQAIATAEGGE